MTALPSKLTLYVMEVEPGWPRHGYNTWISVEDGDSWGRHFPTIERAYLWAADELRNLAASVDNPVDTVEG